jgi:uncharacterized membrane protein YoaK (UPF0700 family)
MKRPSRAFAALMVLSFGTGATDAFAFLNLNGVFTANMTGNLILVGLFKRPGYAATLTPIIVAILVFAAACYVGFRVTRTSDARRQHDISVRLLGVAAIAQLAVLVGWISTGGQPGQSAKVLLVFGSATAMALQTVIAKRLESRVGVTTTFVTGTLANVLQDLVDGVEGNRSIRILSILALVAGAFAGAGSLAAAAWSAPLLPAIAAVVAIPLFAADKTQRARVA